MCCKGVLRLANILLTRSKTFARLSTFAHLALLPALLAVAVSPAAVTASECCNIHENLISLIILVINWPKEEPNQTYSPVKIQ